MAAHFFDSSAVVKRYVQETGSGWVRALADPKAGHRIYLAHITVVEVTSALARRRRGGTLVPHLATTLLAQFLQDLRGGYRIIEITPVLLIDAASLADRHGLRAYDAVQLATALALGAGRVATGASPITLISADRELNAAANGSGLATDDPNAHP